MARTRVNPKPKAEAKGIDWREPGPQDRANKGKWLEILRPLLSSPGRWAMIAEMPTIQKARSTASNLQSRKVLIPRPDDDWDFVSRENEVFAIYRKKAKRETRVRRTQSKR